MATAAAAGAAPGETINRPFVVASIMLATIMQALDTTIANVALPHMQGSLSAAQDQISWVLTSYIVAAAIMTPLTGWLAGRFGRKRVFLVSVAGFTVASMLCGAAISLEQIVLFRLLQGVFGAALVPLSQAVLLDSYPRREHGRAMAIWGSGIMVGPILGPTLGGWLTENYSWRWVFYINLPVGILALAGIFMFVRETEASRRKFDLFGFAFLSLAIGALQMMLDRGEQKDWFASTEIIIEAALAAIGLWIFLIHTFTTKGPFVDPALFKDSNFLTGVLLMFVASAVMYATLALLPPMLAMLNYPVIDAGLLMSPRGITTMIFMMIVGRLIGRVDTRIILTIGLGLIGLSLAQMTEYSPTMDETPIIIAGLVQGAGLGFLFVPLSAAAFSTLPSKLRAEGSGIFSLLRNIGGSLGISVTVAMLSRNIQVNHAELGESLNRFSTALKLGLPPQFSLDSLSGLALADRLINAQAAMIAYINDYKLMMIVCFATIPLLLMLRPAKSAGGGAAAAAMD
ncbi:MAG: DHA2 family efflux MFS transporter permease subunit [Rhodospirillaceae bacterium]|nr:DHA2 family efflux MFS transporter permease subunit [Rhodospirillaceae bacterium]